MVSSVPGGVIAFVFVYKCEPCGWVDPLTSTVAAVFLLSPPSKSVTAQGFACQRALSARRFTLA